MPPRASSCPAGLFGAGLRDSPPRKRVETTTSARFRLLRVHAAHLGGSPRTAAGEAPHRRASFPGLGCPSGCGVRYRVSVGRRGGRRGPRGLPQIVRALFERMLSCREGKSRGTADRVLAPRVAGGHIPAVPIARNRNRPTFPTRHRRTVAGSRRDHPGRVPGAPTAVGRHTKRPGTSGLRTPSPALR